MTVSMIVAKGTNNEIGKNNDLLWYIPSDLKFFKATTMGKSIIMGRKTFQSLPKALPGRKNIVISRDSSFEAPGAVVVSDIEKAINEVLGEIKGEIEQVKVIMNEQVYEHERKDLIHFINGMNQCLCIIDSHISGKEKE